MAKTDQANPSNIPNTPKLPTLTASTTNLNLNKLHKQVFKTVYREKSPTTNLTPSSQLQVIPLLPNLLLTESFYIRYHTSNHKELERCQAYSYGELQLYDNYIYENIKYSEVTYKSSSYKLQQLINNSQPQLPFANTLSYPVLADITLNLMNKMLINVKHPALSAINQSEEYLKLNKLLLPQTTKPLSENYLWTSQHYQRAEDQLAQLNKQLSQYPQDNNLIKNKIDLVSEFFKAFSVNLWALLLTELAYSNNVQHQAQQLIIANLNQVNCKLPNLKKLFITIPYLLTITEAYLNFFMEMSELTPVTIQIGGDTVEPEVKELLTLCEVVKETLEYHAGANIISKDNYIIYKDLAKKLMGKDHNYQTLINKYTNLPDKSVLEYIKDRSLNSFQETLPTTSASAEPKYNSQELLSDIFNSTLNFQASYQQQYVSEILNLLQQMHPNANKTLSPTDIQQIQEGLRLIESYMREIRNAIIQQLRVIDRGLNHKNLILNDKQHNSFSDPGVLRYYKTTDSDKVSYYIQLRVDYLQTLHNQNYDKNKLMDMHQLTNLIRLTRQQHVVNTYRSQVEQKMFNYLLPQLHKTNVADLSQHPDPNLTALWEESINIGIKIKTTSSQYKNQLATTTYHIESPFVLEQYITLNQHKLESNPPSQLVTNIAWV